MGPVDGHVGAGLTAVSPPPVAGYAPVVRPEELSEQIATRAEPLPEERAVGYRRGDELLVELALPRSQLFAMDTGTAIR